MPGRESGIVNGGTAADMNYQHDELSALDFADEAAIADAITPPTAKVEPSPVRDSFHLIHDVLRGGPYCADLANLGLSPVSFRQEVAAFIE
jgi:hypothetical protein